MPTVTYLTKGNELRFVSGDWIQCLSASLLPFDYVVTLWLPSSASEGYFNGWGLGRLYDRGFRFQQSNGCATAFALGRESTTKEKPLARALVLKLF